MDNVYVFCFNASVSQHSFFNLFFFLKHVTNSMTHSTKTSFSENFHTPTMMQQEGGLGTGTKRHSSDVFLKTVLANQRGHWQKVSTREHRTHTRGTDTSQKDAQAPHSSISTLETGSQEADDKPPGQQQGTTRLGVTVYATWRPPSRPPSDDCCERWKRVRRHACPLQN